MMWGFYLDRSVRIRRNALLACNLDNHNDYFPWLNDLLNQSGLRDPYHLTFHYGRALPKHTRLEFV